MADISNEVITESTEKASVLESLLKLQDYGQFTAPPSSFRDNDAFDEEHFERLRTNYVKERLAGFKKQKGLINIYVRVTPHSRSSLEERQWISLESETENTSEDEEVQTIIAPGKPYQFEHAIPLKKSWALIKEIKTMSCHPCAAKYGYLCGVYRTRENAMSALPGLKSLAGELISGMRMLRQIADRSMMAILLAILSSSGEQKELLKKMGKILRRHMRSDGLKVYVLRKTCEGARIQKLFRTDMKEMESVFYPVKKDQGLADWVLRQDDWLLINEAADSKKTGKDKERGFSGKKQKVEILARSEEGVDKNDKYDKEKTLFLIPLRIQNNIVGVISVWRKTKEPYDIELDLSSLQYLSNFLASGLQWHISREKLHQKSTELARLGEAMISGDSFRDVHSALCAGVGKIANVACTILFLNDPEANVLCAIASWTPDGAITQIKGGWQEFLVRYRDPQKWHKQIRKQINEKKELNSSDGKELVFRDVFMLNSSTNYSGAIALLDHRRNEIEKRYLLIEDRLFRHTVKAFLKEAQPLLVSSVQMLTRKVSQKFTDQISTSEQISQEARTDFLHRTADYLQEQTGCDAVLVYQETTTGLKVTATSPVCQDLIGLGASQDSCTMQVIKENKFIRILDVTDKKNPYYKQLDTKTLEEISLTFGWNGIRSWLCVPVITGKRVVGLLKLLTSKDGIYLGPCYTELVKTLATRVEREMQQITQRFMLKELNDISTKLAVNEGSLLKASLATTLEDWCRRFIRPQAQLAILANIDSKSPKLYTYSKNLEDKICKELELKSLQFPETAKHMKVRHIHWMTIPVRIAGNADLSGFLIIIGKTKFNNWELSIAEEAAREIAILLDRERRRFHLTEQIGRFRHAVIGPVQGLNSAALRLHQIAEEGNASEDELRKLRANIAQEAESIRLWRENQRLYTGKIQVIRQYNSLRPCIDKCCMRFSPSLEKRGIKLVVRWKAHSQSLYFNFDKEGLDIAISNILDNASKYTYFNRQVTIGIEEEMYYVRIWIEDVGHPIPPRLDDKLYDVGVRFDWKDPLRSIQGSGLGLPMTKAIIEEHNGTIIHTSKPEGKAIDEDHQPHRVRFTIEIPKGERR